MTACDPKETPPHVWPVPLARHADPAAAALEAAERGIGQVRRLLREGVPDPVGCRAALADLLTASEHLTALWALRGEWLRQVDGSDGGGPTPRLDRNRAGDGPAVE
jgi:hypothetical protein